MRHADFGRIDGEGRIVLPEEAKRKFGLDGPDDIYFEIGENGLLLHRPVNRLAKIYVEPTTYCNLDCATCIRRDWEEPNRMMPEEVFDAVLEGARSCSTGPPAIFFGGFGEPLSHPKIFEWIRRAKQESCRVEAITNGTLLDTETCGRIVDSGLDFLWVSIDGATEESYADVRLGAELPSVLANLKRLRSVRYETGSRTPGLGISFVAMRRNIADLPAVLDWRFTLGIRKTVVTNVLPYSEEMKDEILYRKKVWEWETRSRPVEFTRMDGTPETRDVLGKLLTRFEFTDLANVEFRSPHDTCPFVERGSVSVRVDGKVSPCLALIRGSKSYLAETERCTDPYFVGDVKTSKLLEIWNDEEYRDLRKQLMEFDFSPCSTCNSCELAEGNDEDCFGSEHPACGGCLWAQGFIRCP
jgi:MoaA/NifB/PqqE/SkfB family radical SAM enzyme